MAEQRITGPWDFDLHYIAVGYEEMRARVATGWKVYATALIEQDRSSPAARIRIVAPVPYYFLGRRFTEAEKEHQDQREAAAAEAADSSVAGLTPPAGAQPPDDQEDAPKESTAAPPSPIGSRTERRRRDAADPKPQGDTATAGRRRSAAGGSVEGFEDAPRGAR